MDKLIQLLNEHRAELLHWNIQNKPMRHYGGYIFWLSDLTEQNCILLVISKEYGFIKWLVDNDKIVDFVDKKETLVSLRKWSTSPLWYIEMVTPKYEQLLMLLAIQDKPIDFLIEILK